MTTIYDLVGILVWAWFLMVVVLGFLKLTLRTFNLFNA